jgi:hypothetical protein
VLTGNMANQAPDAGSGTCPISCREAPRLAL